jgi:hypothetical protein
VSVGGRAKNIGAAAAEHFAAGIQFNMHFHADHGFVCHLLILLYVTTL